jgi:hypothetical protein
MDESPYRKPKEFSPSRGVNYVPPANITSPGRKHKIEHDLEDDRLRMRETKADLAKELETETNKRL